MAIINIKLSENRKVYAFFVDFKAAFDRVPRQLLIFKLHEIGLSSKIVKFIENIYIETKSAVWTGTGLSDYFNTTTGVKQGCLLSPMLFSIYLNDLHDYLEGGLFVDDINLRVLMYADDIVILADDPNTLQRMIKRLEMYCKKWGMEVNQVKSEIMVFRNGGRLAASEKWLYNDEIIRVVNEYKYLGLTLTPKLSFSKHLSQKEVAAKVSINSTWKNFISKPAVSLKAKWKMFLSVCRCIHSYGAEVWGNSYFEDVDKLYRYFIKRVLRLPECTPNYIVALETGYEPGYIHTYSLHLSYLSKLLFKLEDYRLPHILALKLSEKNLAWFKDYRVQLSSYNIDNRNIMLDQTCWHGVSQELLYKITENAYNSHIQKAQESERRGYKYLDFNIGVYYCNEKFTLEQISLIMKARGDLFPLNGNKYGPDVDQRCSLCNSGEVESLDHFICRCPVLNGIRIKYFNQSSLERNDLIYILNGCEDFCWLTLCNYLKKAIAYRKTLIEEFNY